MNGLTSIVVRRTFRSSMVRVAIMAGTLHPKPITSGINDLPCRPNERIVRSIKKTARAMYPVSSNTEMKKKRIRICGRKTMTLPTPFMMPSVSKSRNEPSAIIPLIQSPRAATPASIQSIGYCPTVKVVQKVSHIRKRKIGIPQMRCVSTLSIFCLNVRLLCGGAGI